MYRYAFIPIVACVLLSPATAQDQMVGVPMWQAGAATAGESYARGMSGIISAQGQKNLNDAQAANVLTQAQAQHNENKLQSTQIYWQRKEIYEQQQAKQNYALEQKRNRTLQRIAVKPLAQRDFDDKNGAVQWPKMLTATEYDKYREPLEKMLEERAQHGVLDSDAYHNAKLISRQWRQSVASDRDIPFEDRTFASSFIMQVEKTIDQDLG